ncbi:hypothetical protein QZH41_009777 [Actinostola sp. cb2023]|nr:hypothetical protein QZH41_009777 [Actinostola sp. cb2023]
MCTQSSTGLCTLRKWPAPWTTGVAPTTDLPPPTKPAEKFFCYTRIPPCGRPGDVSVNLPCRWMCNDVASKCKGVFENRGIPIADCNFLLPDGQGDEDGICRTSKFPVPFRHFRPPPTHGQLHWIMYFTKMACALDDRPGTYDRFITTNKTCRHVCFPISNEHNDCTRDFSYNTTFISPSDQVKVKVHALQPIIIDSKCSPHAEKFFCYTRIPPCGSPGDVSVNLPCRWMCNDVARKCKDVFENRGIPIADCNFLLPDGQGDEDGICRTSKFPVPFRHFRPPPIHGKPLKCYDLIVPICQHIGFDKTFLSEEKQKAYMKWASDKLNSLRDDITCSLPRKRFLCTENFPPCIDDRIGFYCRSKCQKFFQMNCTSPWKYDVNMCMELPKGTAKNDICKQTHWPRAENWPQVRSTEPPIVMNEVMNDLNSLKNQYA